MGRVPCCSKVGLDRGPWTPREDSLLKTYVQIHGEGNWRNLPKNAGLLRCGKSCRLRWMNYLRPDIKRGNISLEEEDLIIRLHRLLGNRWSLIAGRLPGRTDNEIKNYWNTRLSQKQKTQGSRPKSRRTQQTQKKGIKEKKLGELKESRAEREVNEKIKIKNEIHTPKPVRVRGFFKNSMDIGSDDQGLYCRISTTTSEGKIDHSADNFGINWSTLKEDNSFTEQDFRSLVLDSDLPLQDNSFGRLYLEYSQLLNSDEDQLQINLFANSLFNERR